MTPHTYLADELDKAVAFVRRYVVLTPVQAWRSWRTAQRLRVAYSANSELGHGSA